MIKDKIQIRDFTSLAEPSDSVVLVYFEEMEGTVHVYRDGTVVLSSPFGTTVTRLKYAGDRLWRKETFLTILAQMGFLMRNWQKQSEWSRHVMKRFRRWASERLQRR